MQKSFSEIPLSTYFDGIQNGDSVILSRAITLIESHLEVHKKLSADLLKKILPRTGKSIRIGITGSPGVGKSTFINRFGQLISEQGKKIAVLTIDPSSQVTSGSILGDKTRMTELSSLEDTFIRPSPAQTKLGGVAPSTKESILLCEAAGFDVIIIESVGVGQSETTVKHLCDIFVYLTTADAGDELQGIKRGIMELSDLVLVNKSDLQNDAAINRTLSDLKNALHLFPTPKIDWSVPVIPISSISSTGLYLVWENILKFIESSKKASYFDSNRKDQEIKWLEEKVKDKIIHQYFKSEKYDNLKSLVAENKISVLEATQRVSVT